MLTISRIHILEFKITGFCVQPCQVFAGPLLGFFFEATLLGRCQPFHAMLVLGFAPQTSALTASSEVRLSSNHASAWSESPEAFASAASLALLFCMLAFSCSCFCPNMYWMMFWTSLAYLPTPARKCRAVNFCCWKYIICMYVSMYLYPYIHLYIDPYILHFQNHVPKPALPTSSSVTCVRPSKAQ